MIPDLHFDLPWALLGLVFLPVYAVVRHRLWRRDAVPYAPLQYRPQRNSRSTSIARAVLELALLAVCVVALAGPHRSIPLELMDDEGVDVLLVLDISLSMLAEDFPPNRLEALREIAHDFISRSGSNRLGLVVFAKDTFVQTPLTTDHLVLRQLLDSVSVLAVHQGKSGGTAVGDALLVAAERLASARVEGRGQALVLITDGESNAGIDPALAARYVRQQDIRLYSIGIGGTEPVEVFFQGERVGGDDPYFAFLDDTQLRQIAAEADGRYYRATDVGTLEQIFAQLSRLESAPLEVRTVEIRRHLTSYLALLALPLFGAVLVLQGVVLRRPLR